MKFLTHILGELVGVVVVVLVIVVPHFKTFFAAYIQLAWSI